MKHYTGDYAQQVVFPLSGIGSGGLGISGIGSLVDWELKGIPNKGSVNEYSHFALKAERNGQTVDARVLQGDHTCGLSGNDCAAHHHSWGYGHGLNRTTLGGIAHCRDVDFCARFPFAELRYADPDMPAKLLLTAFNPFIPQDEDNSSLPAAFFNWTITNTSDAVTDYTLAFSVGNPFRISDGGFNLYSETDGIPQILLSSRDHERGSNSFGELCVSTDSGDVFAQEYWYRSGFFDDVTTFWREFSTPGRLPARHYDDNDRRGQLDNGDMCTLAARIRLSPGESGTIRFLLCWYFPHFFEADLGDTVTLTHEYARRFSSAGDVLSYCRTNRDALYARSRAFADALCTSSMPDICREAAAANLCVLKSPTCLRLDAGDFWAYEGINAKSGSCEGTCDHVWNYQYALPFLFPSTARRILEISLEHSLSENGELMFRTMLPLGSEPWHFRACADGQFGFVIRFYREWKLSGDDDWLRKWWPDIKRMIAYAWDPESRDKWDPQKSGVLTGRQHHTLDMELFGPNSWLTGFYLGALKAAAEIADYLGENRLADEYRTILRRGQDAVESRLFNGRYYTQDVDIKDKSVLERFAPSDNGILYTYWNDEESEIKYQYGEGCEIDQLVAQWHANLTGLGDLFDPEHRKTALHTLYETNFKSMREVFNPCRIFAANDERGLIICNWPKYAYKPKIPVPYTEECMTGFEYAAAGLMIQEGLSDEGLSVIEAIRERYDGKKRNPFSEIECGAHYARSMASFALLATYSGFVCDLPRGRIGFRFPCLDQPKEEQRFFWSAGCGWGTACLSCRRDRIELVNEGAELSIQEYLLPDGFDAAVVSVDGKQIPFSVSDNLLRFAMPVRISHSLSIAGSERTI